MQRLLIIIPARNEERTLGSVVEGLFAQKICSPDTTVLIIDDYSEDSTAEVIADLVLKFPQVKSISLTTKTGFGSVITYGLKYAKANNFDIVVQCDADGQHPLQEIPRLCDTLKSEAADLVIGSRYIKGHSELNASSLFRRAGGKLISELIFRLSQVRVYDPTSGFRALSQKAVETLLTSDSRRLIEPETIFELSTKAMKVVEIPVKMSPRRGGQSNLTAIRSVSYMFTVILDIVLISTYFRKRMHQPVICESLTKL